MAILFITHKFPPGIGGMQKQSYELINCVRKHTKVYTIIQSSAESKIGFFLKLKYRIRKMLDNHPDIEIIHCNDSVMACACIWIKRRYGIPITATFHGLDIVFPNLVFQKFVVPRLWELERVFVVSSATRRECLERGFGNDQVVEINNGVDHNIVMSEKGDLFDLLKKEYNVSLEGRQIVLSIGRSVKRKGFSWFARNVMPNLPDNVVYLIVGPRSNKKSLGYMLLQMLPDQIRRQIELFLGYPTDDNELDIALQDPSCKTIHLGVLPWSILQRLMSSASIVVMPNIPTNGDMEGFGLVGLEANLAGLYVVAADTDGITSAIRHNRNGILLPPKSQDVWSLHISKLLNNPNNLAIMGRGARSYVLKNFSWTKMGYQYFTQLEMLTSGKSCSKQSGQYKSAS